MERVFISYCREDEDFARRLATDLNYIGIDIWIDVDDIPPSMDWSNAIDQGLKECEAMILIITPTSMKSPEVEEEWKYFKRRSKPLIPVRLQPSEVHFWLDGLQYVDFYQQDYDTAFDELRRALRGETQIPKHPNLDELISRIRYELWVSGINLNIVKEYVPEFKQLAAEGKRFRFMFVSPQGEQTLQEIVEYVGLGRQILDIRLSASQRELGQLVRDFPDQVDVRVMQQRPSCGYFIVDPVTDQGLMTVNSYFYHIDRVKSEVPAEQLAKGGYLSPILRLPKQPTNRLFDGWFEAYVRDFERLWANAQSWQPPITDV